MPPILARPLPTDSLLARHSGARDRTDCYTVEVPLAVALEAFVAAFYTSWGFLPERLILGLLGRGSSAAEARRLARGEVERFAAWRVEARTGNELLMLDFASRTRSWLKIEPLSATSTRLHFGSGILHRDGHGLHHNLERGLFHALLPFHAAYSQVLLRSAVGSLSASG